MDPIFFTMRSHLMTRLTFNLFSENMIFRKDLESPLIFVLFLKGKQNKKENSKCDSLFGKDKFMKNRVWVRGSGYLLGRYGKDHSTPLIP